MIINNQSISTNNNTMNSNVYDLKTLLNMNNVDLTLDDTSLISFLTTINNFKITKEMRFHYPNKHNVHFNRLKARPKNIICQDPEIIKNIRSLLGKISVQNYDTIKDKIVDLCKNNSVCWDELSKYIHNIIIDNIFIIDAYINLLIDLEKNGFKKLIYNIHQLIVEQINNPKNFENDTLSETAIDKVKRWKISNSILLVNLFNRGKYSKEFLNKQLDHWVSEININNQQNLEILLKIVPLFANDKLPIMNDNVKTKLQNIIDNKAYPSRFRLMLQIR